ncbi:MAG: hypothetical protein HQ536_04730 [Parcubacteria group bacterium]|nr:hypothetical protein [Parcubacteria group bacterium]
MTNKQISQGARKFIRKEKARIRREVSDLKEREEMIKKLTEKFFKNVKRL